MAKRTKRRNVRYSRKRNSRKKRVSKRRQRVSRRRVSKKTYKHKNMKGGALTPEQKEENIEYLKKVGISEKRITEDLLNKLPPKDELIQLSQGDLKRRGVPGGDALKIHRGNLVRGTLKEVVAAAPPTTVSSTSPPTAAPVSASPKLVKKFIEDKTIYPYRELFNESGKTRELIGGILSHGSQQKVSSIDEFTFTITPVDLYLMTSDEVDLLDDWTIAALRNKWNYFRKYTAGSLIQNYDLNFYTNSDPEGYIYGDVQGSFAFGGLLHFSEGLDTEQLIEYLIYRDDMQDHRKMFSHHEDIYFHKELLNNKVDDPNFNGEIMYKLSDIFKYIAAAKRKGEVVPDKWIGRFCRGGGDDVFPLDISFFGDCRNSELGNLPEDFFKGKVDVSNLLLRQSSLSTSNMLQNFSGIFNDIMEYVSSGNTIPDIIEKYIISNYDMTLQDFLEIMKSTIEGFHPLKYKDICVILLMYNILTS